MLKDAYSGFPQEIFTEPVLKLSVLKAIVAALQISSWLERSSSKYSTLTPV